MITKIIILLIFPTSYLTSSALQCLQCNSISNSDCIFLQNLKPSNCLKSEVSQCYVNNTNGYITRGCLEDPNDTCTKEEIKCELCPEDGCNNQTICKNCTSNEDAQCSQTDVGDMKFNQICKSAKSECIVKIIDKNVERHCASEEENCEVSKYCLKCKGSNCNSNIFPENRLRCYQCSGSQCDYVIANGIVSLPCKNFEENDKCYTVGDNSTNMIRGCLSDNKENICSSPENSGCIFCNSDNCNNLPYERDQMLRCIQCSSSDQDLSCFQEQSPDMAKNCENKILYNYPEICYTILKDNKIQRGCLYDNENIKNECLLSSEHCKLCNNTQGCNYAAETSPFTCIVCRSDLDRNCWDNADTLKGETCRNPPKNNFCFHGIWNNVVIRGCLSDATERMLAVCVDPNNHQCHICQGKDCNNGKSSKGVALKLNYVLWLLSALVLHKLY